MTSFQAPVESLLLVGVCGFLSTPLSSLAGVEAARGLLGRGQEIEIDAPGISSKKGPVRARTANAGDDIVAGVEYCNIVSGDRLWGVIATEFKLNDSCEGERGTAW